MTPYIAAAGQLTGKHVRRNPGQVKPQNVHVEPPFVGFTSPVLNDVEIAKVDVKVPSLEVEDGSPVHHLAPFEGTKHPARPAKFLEWPRVDFSSVVDSEVPVAVWTEVAASP